MNHFRRTGSLVVVVVMLGLAFSLFSVAAQDTPGLGNVDVQIDPVFGLCSITPDEQVGTDSETTGTGFADAVTTGTGFADAVTTGTGFADAVTTGTAFDLGQFIDDFADFADDVQDNEIAFQWVTDYVTALQASPLFNEQQVAILILDNQDHGRGVLQTVNASLAAMGSPANIQVELIDIGAESGAYEADQVAARLEDRVTELQAEGVDFFVTNMSFALVPCVATVTFTDTNETFEFNFNDFVELLLDTQALAAEPDPSLVKPVDACYIREASEGFQYITIHFTYENPNPVPVDIPPTENNNTLTLLSEEGDANYRNSFETKKVPYQFFKSAEAPYHGFDIGLEVNDGASWQLQWELNGEVITADSTLSDFDPENDIIPECDFSYATDTDLYLSDGSEEGVPIGACVREIDGTLVAFMDVFNPSDEALVLWPFSNAILTVAYGGYDYFGVEAVPITIPPGLSAYPQNAIQIPIINSEDGPLEVYFSNSSTEFSDFIAVDLDLESNACPEPQYLEWRYSIVDYLVSVLGVPESRTDEFIAALFTETSGLDPDDTPFTGLDDLLREYLERSADPTDDFGLAAVAASGNFAAWFADFFGFDPDDVPPLAPAIWNSTIAAAGTYGPANEPWGYTAEDDTELQFTHIGDVAAPAGSYCFGTLGCGTETDRPGEAVNADDWQRYLLGTSYSTPGISAVLAGYLSTGTCTFPVVDGEARPPLIELDTLPSTPLLPGNEVFTCSLEAPTTGSITVVKEVIYNADVDVDSDRDFAFFSTQLGNFSLDDPLTDDSDGVTDTETFSNLAAGSYTIIENPNGNWNQTVTCVGDDDVTYLSPDIGASIDLDAGENVTCTFTNERITYDLTYEKALAEGTAPLAGNWEFTLASLLSPFDGTIDQDFGVVANVPGAGGSSTLTLPLEAYKIGEVVPAGYDLQLIDCGAGGISTMPPLDDEFTIILDQDLTCVFTNAEEAAANLPPTIAPIPNQVNQVGDTITPFAVNANDPEDLPLSFIATGLPGDVVLDRVSGIFSGTIAESTAPGEYLVTVTVTDSVGQEATAIFTWTIEAPDPTTPPPTTPAPTTPAPTTPAPSGITALEVCWVEDQNNATTVWRVTNPNTVPLEPGTPLKVIFDWETYDSDGNPLQNAQRCDQTGETQINTNLSYAIEVSWFLFDNSVSEPLGTVRAEATEAFRCDAEPTPEETPSPEVTDAPTETPEDTPASEEPEQGGDDEPTPSSTPTPEEPQEGDDEPAPTTPAPDPVTPAPDAAAPLTVCWVEDQNGATTVWEISNPNSVPLTPGTQQKVVFDWTAFDETGAALQSAERWEQTGTVRLSTPLANSLQVTWSLFNNGPLQPLGTTIAFASEEDRCE